MKNEAKRFLAPQAWLQGAWAYDVVLEVAPDGRWSHVQANATPEQQADAMRLNGPVLPGVVNAHSHGHGALGRGAAAEALV